MMECLAPVLKVFRHFVLALDETNAFYGGCLDNISVIQDAYCLVSIFTEPQYTFVTLLFELGPFTQKYLHKSRLGFASVSVDCIVVLLFRSSLPHLPVVYKCWKEPYCVYGFMLRLMNHDEPCVKKSGCRHPTDAFHLEHDGLSLAETGSVRCTH